MKLRNTIKMMAMAGLAAMVLPISAQAASGLHFGQWTVTSTAENPGKIEGCPSGVDADCKLLIAGDGFLQQEYTDGSTVYIQTIIIDPGVATTTDLSGLDYRDESFVKMGGVDNGIAAQQSINDTAKGFISTTKLYTGWADSIKPSANFEVTQGFTDVGGSAEGDEFINSFNLKINLNADGEQTGKEMRVEQTVEMGNGVVANTSDIQKFLVIQMSGNMLTATLSNSLTLQKSGDDAPDGGTVSWESGDDLMLVWLGQAVDTDGNGLSKFGFERVNNKTVEALNSDEDTGNNRYVSDSTTVLQQSLATTFSTTITGGEDVLGGDTSGTGDGLGDFQIPFAWNSIFGDAPTLPAPN